MKLTQLKEAKGKLTDQIRDGLEKRWARKPNTYKELMNSSYKISKAELKEQFPKIDKIRTFSDFYVYGDPIPNANEPPMEEFTKKMPHVFFLSTDFGMFLINTEGYNYAKYLLWVK